MLISGAIACRNSETNEVDVFIDGPQSLGEGGDLSFLINNECTFLPDDCWAADIITLGSFCFPIFNAATQYALLCDHSKTCKFE